MGKRYHTAFFDVRMRIVRPRDICSPRRKTFSLSAATLFLCAFRCSDRFDEYARRLRLSRTLYLTAIAVHVSKLHCEKTRTVVH